MPDEPPAGFGSGLPAPEPGDALRDGGVPTGELIMELAAPGYRPPLGLSQPEVQIDGYPVPAHWGQNPVRVPVGTRAVTVCTRNPLNFIQPQFARAAIRVEVGPGQQIPLYYSLPFFAHMGGAIGFERQHRPGRSAFLWLIIAPGAIGLLIGLIAVVATWRSH